MSQTDASGERADDAVGSEAAGADRRQAAIVLLCLLGLVVAAFVAPIAPDRGGLGGAGPGGGGMDGGDGSGEGEGSGGGGESERSEESDGGSGGADGGGDGGASGGLGGSGGGGSGDGSDGGSGGAADDGSGDSGDGEGSSGDGDVITDDGRPIPVPGGEEPPTERGCAVVVLEKPVPGDTVAVRVYNQLEPAAGIMVWFNDYYVGRTDGTGRVAGRVPYTRDLNVTVRVPGEDCEFFRRPYEDESQSTEALESSTEELESSTEALKSSTEALKSSTEALEPPAEALEPATFDAASTFDTAATGSLGQLQFGPTEADSTDFQALSAPDDQNDTAPYEVHGSVNISVVGAPYPGEQVTVLASIEGVPMRDATVRVDDERVGETTESGRYELQVPADADQFSVQVERGDFSGRTTVDVWHLSIDVVPQEGLPFPGEPAVVTASAGPKPSPNATVTLDGNRLGRTDRNGTAGFSLPVDPRGEITVQTDRQRATTSLWAAYASTVLPSALLLVAGVVAVGGTARARGRSAAKRVALWWLGVVTLFVGLVVGEGLGLLTSLGLVLVGSAVIHRETVAAGGLSLAGLLRAAVAFARHTALAVADWTARALDRVWALLGRLATRIASLPLSVRGLASRFWAWLCTVPDRVRATLAASLSWRRLGVATGILAVLGGLMYRFGGLGFLGGLVAVFLGFVTYRWWTRTASGADSTGDADAGAAAVTPRPPSSGGDGPRRRTLRALWRRFARWVRPHDWRQSTPGEVSRAAIDRGFPERPVRALTDAFRDVEYGDRSPTERSETAREAFDSIERHREGEDS